MISGTYSPTTSLIGGEADLCSLLDYDQRLFQLLKDISVDPKSCQLPCQPKYKLINGVSEEFFYCVNKFFSSFLNTFLLNYVKYLSFAVKARFLLFTASGIHRKISSFYGSGMSLMQVKFKVNLT